MIIKNKTYRYSNISSNLISFEVCSEETDLWIRANEDLTDIAMDLVLTCRKQIRDQIQKNPSFLTSFIPVAPVFPIAPIVHEMSIAANIAQTGPMAAVAGAVATYVGKGLEAFSQNVIVENGGDLYITSQTPITIGVYAGESVLSNKIGITIPACQGIGVCTSSGTVGHSYSRGKADAVCVVANNPIVADAIATQLGNYVQTPKDFSHVMEMGKKNSHVQGILLIIKDQMAVWGDIQLVSI